MGKGQRIDKTGRSTGNRDFVMLERYLLKSLAWRSMRPVARCAYIEIAFGYDGKNNGRIQMAARILGDRLGMDKATALRAISELEIKGFIEISKKSSFDFKMKQCQEYRLTAFRCDVTGALPTKTFMKWTPQIQNTVASTQPNRCTHATEESKTTHNSPFQLHQRNRKGAKPPDHGCTSAPLLHSTIGGVCETEAVDEIVSRDLGKADVSSGSHRETMGPRVPVAFSKTPDAKSNDPAHLMATRFMRRSG